MENVPKTAVTSEEPKPDRRREVVLWIMHSLVLVLSVLLIVFISADTFENVNFLANHRYMTFQFWVCMGFIADFFVELAYADRKWRYVRRRFSFLLLSIPYLNILNATDIELSYNALYFVRFIPLARGALALSIVFGYFSKNALTSFFMSYLVILIMVVYFCSLIFYQAESQVNPEVSTYWTALWWAGMTMGTAGCYITPLTVSGRVVGVILPIAGMVIFPLFTVYLTDYVKRHAGQQLPSTTKSRGK